MKDTVHSIINSRKTGVIVSVVSLVLIMCLLVVATYSWVETGNEGEVDSSNNLSFDVSPDLDISGNNVNDGKIEIKDFVLREVSSVDGRNVYVPDDSFYSNGDNRTTTDELRFREANPADVYDGIVKNKPSNMRYVSFSLYISSASGSETPVYLSNNSGITGTGNKFVRMSIDTHDGNAPKVLSSSAVYGYEKQSPVNAVSSINSDYTAKTELQNYEAFTTYAYIGEAKPLFTIDANKKKRITVTLWLEGASGDFPDNIVGKDDDKINAHISLKTSKDYVNTIKVMDLTQETWVDDDNCYLFVFDANNYDPNKEPYENPSYKMTYNSSTYTWTTYIPQDVTQIYIQRYNPDNPTNGNWNTWGYGDVKLTIPGADALTAAQKEVGITRTYKIFGHYDPNTVGIKEFSAGFWDENPNLNHDKGMTYVYTFDATEQQWITNNNGSTYVDYKYKTSYGDTVQLRYKMSAQLNRNINRFWRITLPENMVNNEINFYRCAEDEKDNKKYKLISGNEWKNQEYSSSSKFFALIGDTTCYRGTTPIYFHHNDSNETMGAYCYGTGAGTFRKMYDITYGDDGNGNKYHAAIVKYDEQNVIFASFNANTENSKMAFGKGTSTDQNKVYHNHKSKDTINTKTDTSNSFKMGSILEEYDEDGKKKFSFGDRWKMTELPNANETAYSYGK